MALSPHSPRQQSRQGLSSAKHAASSPKRRPLRSELFQCATALDPLALQLQKDIDARVLQVNNNKTVGETKTAAMDRLTKAQVCEVKRMVNYMHVFNDRQPYQLTCSIVDVAWQCVTLYAGSYETALQQQEVQDWLHGYRWFQSSIAQMDTMDAFHTEVCQSLSDYFVECILFARADAVLAAC